MVSQLRELNSLPSDAGCGHRAATGRPGCHWRQPPQRDRFVYSCARSYPDAQFDRVIAQEVADFRRHARAVGLGDAAVCNDDGVEGCHRRR